MHPCQACGYTEVDPAGYCTRCRAYRGAVSYEAAAPAGTVYGAPYDDGWPAPGYEAAVPQAEPLAEAAPVAAPVHRGHRLVMPLFVLTVIALLLTSGTLVVLVFRSDAFDTRDVTTAAQDPTRTTPAPSSAPPSSAPVLDTCVVGTWAVASALQVDFDDDGKAIALTSNDGGGSWQFGADGAGTYTLGGITYQHTPTKRKLVGNGSIAFTVRSAANALTFSDVKANAAYTYTEHGETSTTPVPNTPQVFEYACGDNTLVLEDESSRYNLRRS
jgi:hypothetical protein